mmetsp:Transcript_7145/g.11784  ORF Transcript_7145/g.11784 Transcript_7145/m.11784 type:complete len:258 (+) Transcript_7145:124-897(+)
MLEFDVEDFTLKSAFRSPIGSHHRGIPSSILLKCTIFTQGGRRIGFDVVTIPEGFRAPLARKGGPRGWPKVGAYSVDLKSFEKLALPTLNPDSEHLRDVDVIICDEIGRMELKSAKFAKEMKALLARDEVHIFGAMTAPRYGHRVPYCDEVADLKEVAVHNIKKSNRDDVREALMSLILDRFVQKNPRDKIAKVKGKHSESCKTQSKASKVVDSDLLAPVESKTGAKHTKERMKKRRRRVALPIPQDRTRTHGRRDT